MFGFTGRGDNSSSQKLFIFSSPHPCYAHNSFQEPTNGSFQIFLNFELNHWVWVETRLAKIEQLNKKTLIILSFHLEKGNKAAKTHIHILLLSNRYWVKEYEKIKEILRRKNNNRIKKVTTNIAFKFSIKKNIGYLPLLDGSCW